MGAFLFSMKMLKKEYKKTFMYAFTLMFTIAACLIFFNIMANETLVVNETVRGGGNWVQVSVPLTTGLAFLIIIFCSAMIIFANNFYLTKKTKELAITTMSGASFGDMNFYLIYQNFAITLIVMPLGLLLGYIFCVLSNYVMYDYLNMNTSIFIVSGEAFFNTFITVLAMIGALILYSSGYVYRHDIQFMLSTQTVNNHEDHRIIRLPKMFYLLVYIVGILLMIFSEYSISIFIFPCFVGILGAGGIMSHVLPDIFAKIKKKKLITNQILLVSVSNLAYSLKQSILLVSLYCISCTSMIALLVSQQNDIKNFLMVVIGFVITIVLLSLGILYKYFSEAIQRQILFFNLYKLGYTRDKIKKIIKYEVIYYYLIITLIPLIYIGIILTRCYIHHDIHLIFGLLIVFVEILTPIVIGVITYINYKNTVLKIIEEGVHYE